MYTFTGGGKQDKLPTISDRAYSIIANLYVYIEVSLNVNTVKVRCGHTMIYPISLFWFVSFGERHILNIQMTNNQSHESWGWIINSIPGNYFGLYDFIMSLSFHQKINVTEDKR